MGKGPTEEGRRSARVGGGHSILAVEEGDERELSKKVVKILQDLNQSFFFFC